MCSKKELLVATRRICLVRRCHAAHANWRQHLRALKLTCALWEKRDGTVTSWRSSVPASRQYTTTAVRGPETVLAPSSLNSFGTEVQRFDGHLTKVDLFIVNLPLHFFSSYVPQAGCCDQMKDDFWRFLDEKTAAAPPEEIIVVETWMAT